MKAVFDIITGDLVLLNPPSNHRSRLMRHPVTNKLISKERVRELTEPEMALLTPSAEEVTARQGMRFREVDGILTLVPKPPAAINVPSEIANWRARAVLELAGHISAVESALAEMEGNAGIVARAAWLAGAPLARRGATVVALAAALELTDAQVDAMFIQAASLAV